MAPATSHLQSRQPLPVKVYAQTLCSMEFYRPTKALTPFKRQPTSPLLIFPNCFNRPGLTSPVFSWLLKPFRIVRITISTKAVQSKTKREHPQMDRASIIVALEAQRDRLNSAIAALQGNRNKLKTAPGKQDGRRRRLSAAARRKIGEAMKKRWAERKKAAA